MNWLPSRIPRVRVRIRLVIDWEDRTCEDGCLGAFNIQLDNLTILHVYDPISLRRELVVVGHNDKGRTASLVQFAHQAEQSFASVGVQIAGWFVGEYQIRLLE